MTDGGRKKKKGQRIMEKTSEQVVGIRKDKKREANSRYMTGRKGRVQAEATGSEEEVKGK